MEKRELLFRAWLPESEIMVYSEKASQNKDWCKFLITENGIEIYTLQEEDYLDEFDNTWQKRPAWKPYEAVIMQFTGKRDRKGYDIYESDKIEFDRDEWGGNNNIHVVEWDNNNSEWSWGGGLTSDMQFRTVIGNIYENK